MKSNIYNLSSMLIIALAYLLISSSSLAQAPQGISHQAVIRNAANELVSNASIGIQVSILQGSAEGIVVYSETHLPTSNANGLITFVIGQGLLVSGLFDKIDWASGPFFIETKADPTGGTSYTIEGTSQMLSVPYALNANNASSLTLTDDNGLKYQLSIDQNGNLITSIIRPPCPGTPTITDIEGNVYNTVQIGDQCWMRENLKTTQYRNGTPIENPTGNSDWQNNTTGAYVWHSNDIGWKDSYGALYNWHAVNNANGLCPTGWHVPTDADFTVLTDILGGDAATGGKMKSIRTSPDPHPRWDTPNTGATNESNWSGLPSSGRDSEGGFASIGTVSAWWSSTESSASSATSRLLWYDYSGVITDSIPKGYGLSVRCLRD